MTHHVLVLNGPNLNLLGKRQPEIYGYATLQELDEDCIRIGEALGLDVECTQSNAEHELLDQIHAAREKSSALVINAGAFSHTSIALLDALNMFEGPVMEVHISNIHARESFRHHSWLSQRAEGVIVGCGTDGYRFALQRLATLLETV